MCWKNILPGLARGDSHNSEHEVAGSPDGDGNKPEPKKSTKYDIDIFFAEVSQILPWAHKKSAEKLTL